MRKNEFIQSNIEGKDYKFELKKMSRDDIRNHQVKGKYLLIVNDEEIVVRKSNSMFINLDEPFSFDGKEARLVRINQEIDIAYNGVYLESGRRYIGVPRWIWLFIGMCLISSLIAGLPMSIPIMIIGFGGSYLYRAISKKKPSSCIHDIIIFLATTRITVFLFIFRFGMERTLYLLRVGILIFIITFLSVRWCVETSRKEYLFPFINIFYCLLIAILANFLSLMIIGLLAYLNIL